jgi:integrase
VIPKFPFITVEKEIDDLIAVSGRKNAALCQVFDDTTMRSGEAKRILWTDLDVERRTITLNQP